MIKSLRAYLTATWPKDKQREVSKLHIFAMSFNIFNGLKAQYDQIFLWVSSVRGTVCEDN